MADAIFEEPRLAEIYDALDGDRSDLDHYVAIVDELGAEAVLDVGCGTGSLAVRLAALGKTVIGLDPAGASLDVARRKADADSVRWVHGDVSALPPLKVDLVTMTGNVAQAFLTETGWQAVLDAAQAALRPGGFFVFETRDPACRAWKEWTQVASQRRIDVPDVGPIQTWVDLTAVTPPLVSFRHTFVFETDTTVLTSESTLRFRDRAEIVDTLANAGFVVGDVRDAPDRPGLELVFIAERP